MGAERRREAGPPDPEPVSGLAGLPATGPFGTAILTLVAIGVVVLVVVRGEPDDRLLVLLVAGTSFVLGLVGCVWSLRSSSLGAFGLLVVGGALALAVVAAMNPLLGAAGLFSFMASAGVAGLIAGRPGCHA